jgi:hypothetical protein
MVGGFYKQALPACAPAVYIVMEDPDLFCAPPTSFTQILLQFKVQM